MAEVDDQASAKGRSRLKSVPFYVIIMALIVWGGLAEYVNLFGTTQNG